ncbi:MAG: hypothetical protein AB8G95_16050 [Anaerolineae bacterium]
MVKKDRWIVGVLILLLTVGVTTLTFWGVYYGLNAYRNREIILHPSEQICLNLVSKNLILRSQCFITTDPVPIDYMAHYFPEGEVDKSYVESGMEGIEIISESSSKCKPNNKTIPCSRLSYRVTDRWLAFESFGFYFRNDQLFMTIWHN